MSKEQEAAGLGVRPGQVMSAALAAVTAAVLGSTMGVAGTVLGAGLASVVTTVGTALYLRSLDRTRDGVRLVRDRVSTRVGAVPTQSAATAEPTEPGTPAETTAAETTSAEDRPPVPQPRRVRWGAVLAGSALAFALGMLAITAYEQISGSSLSGGTGTTIGDVVHQRPAGADPQRDQRDHDAPVTKTSTVTVTVPASPDAPSGTPTTSPSAPTSSPGSTTSPPPTTSSVPVTTTTTAPSKPSNPASPQGAPGAR